jgi:large subunit ribosomal protein L29
MALIRTKDIRGMRREDISAKLKELSDELMHERGVAAMGGAPASPGKIRAIRSNIARIHTIMRELELEEEKKAESEAPSKKKAAKKPAASKKVEKRKRKEAESKDETEEEKK